MKSITKKVVFAALMVSMTAGLFAIGFKPAKAASSVDLATFTFSKTDGPSTAKDLNDTYGTNADTGYSPKSGKFTTSKLFASVLSPADTKSYKKLEWATKATYSDGGKMTFQPIMESSEKNPWGKSPFFTVRTSTKGYENITFSFKLGGSNKGPKNFGLEYSTDGKTFKSISNTSIVLKSNKIMYAFSFNLPDACDNNSILHLRIIATSTATIEGGSFTSVPTSGENAINNVSVKGTAIVAKPTATPAPKATTKPSTSTNTNTSTNNTGTTATTSKKTLPAPLLTAYKAGTKTIKGSTLSKAKVVVKAGGKTYKVTASKSGSFKVKLSKKLKKGKTIKLYATKSGYKKSSTRKYTVK